MLEFSWDPAKEKKNRRKHAISFAEATTIFEDSLAKIFPDQDHSHLEFRELIIGRSLLGKLLIVSFTEIAPDQVRIISARRLTKTEREDYEKAL